MLASLCLISGVLAAAQAKGGTDFVLTARFERGQELLYRGSYTEEAVGQAVQFARSYRLENRVLVLDTSPQGVELACLTVLKRKPPPGQASDPRQSGEPASVRLEVARIDPRGKLVANATALLVPIMGPPTIDLGCVVEVPPGRIRLDETWEVGEEGRAPITWMVVGTENINGISCVKIAGLQQSPDWDRPRADHTAWRRQDFVWLSSRNGMAQRVERRIEQREPARREANQRSVTRYELESSLVYPAQLYEDRAREILHFRSVYDNAEPLLREPGKLGPAAYDAISARIGQYADHHAPTAYREALMHLKQRLESAKRGQAAPAVGRDPIDAMTVAASGKVAPDFLLTNLVTKESVRLHRLLGKPVLLVFYNPASHLAGPLLRFAQSIHEDQPDVAVLGLAVCENTDTAVKQYADQNLGFVLLPGKSLRLSYAVDVTPRLVVLDGQGIVHSSFTGWGPEIPGAVQDELNRWKKR